MKRVRANLTSALYPIINPYINHFRITELENSILLARFIGGWTTFPYPIPILFNSTNGNNFTFKYFSGSNHFLFGISTNKTFNQQDANLLNHQ